MPASDIVIKGAREHNLRDVDLVLPRNRLICLTGVSGSGKSSLAFDTLFAEGQRRYVESLSSFARQFLGQMPKPDVDLIDGLSPSISIAQKSSGQNPRSTVGTITEIYDYLRVLFARTGQGHCPRCRRPITAQSREQILAQIGKLRKGTRFSVLAPIVRGQKGEYRDLFEDLLKQGFVRARVDGTVVALVDDLQLDRRMRHDIEVVVDRLVAGPDARARLAEAIDLALRLGEGNLIILPEEDGMSQGKPTRRRRRKKSDDAAQVMHLSAHYACTHCGISFEPPTPQMFSFNSPQGMCPECVGLGELFSFDPELLIPDPSLSFKEGCFELIGPWRSLGRWRRHIFQGVAEALERENELEAGTVLETAWEDLDEDVRQSLLAGTGDLHITYTWRHGGSARKYGGIFEGIVPDLLSRYRNMTSKIKRRQLEKYMNSIGCRSCGGQRLNAQARAVRLSTRHERFAKSATLTLPEICHLSIDQAADFFSDLELDDTRQLIATEVLKEIRGRLGFLLNVGLNYLALNRAAPTLSGGESQRIRLAGQIGSGLVGVTYILDEPSIGLHPRDNGRLLDTLTHLRDMGNTVVVVEHDEDTMRSADHIVDFGPGPGVRGGEIVASGTVDDICHKKKSVTGRYLAGKEHIDVPSKRREPTDARLKIIGARHNNLKGIDIEIPLGTFVCVTGVSGSGKSSFVSDILVEALRRDLNHGNGSPGPHERIEGLEHLDKMIAIDQSPIGRTPRSNPSTYIKVFDDIRRLYTQLSDAKARGYKPGRFSFNVKGGRCEACEGNGSNRLEMDFLADIWVTCPVCEGHRFNRETLQILFKGKSISDVLEMDVQQALAHFENITPVRHKLQTLHDVGLDYLKLGQPSPTLSGGEAQRIKLARELVKKSTGQTLYLLDEPTTGLHFADIKMLLKVLQDFVDAGNTVLVVEHNLDVVKTADWVIDMGPEGGEAGGRIVAAGSPEQIAREKHSHTGRVLGEMLTAGSTNGGSADNRATSQTNGSLRRNGRQSAGTKSGDLPSRHDVKPIKAITVQGARQHNLKSIDVEIPRDKLTVCCGLSGSGKSSLAIDTVYAEGQRRYVESLSSYARQFVSQMQKPQVEHISGLSPAVAIEQKNMGNTPRSTVGTVTEIYDYLRILYARLGKPYCPDCDTPIGTQTADEVVDKIMDHAEGTKLYLTAPVEIQVGERYEALWEETRAAGYVRIRVDGETFSLEEPPVIDRRRKHNVEVVVDRVTVRRQARSRIADSVESALSLGKGLMKVVYPAEEVPEVKWREVLHNQHFACDRCGRSFEPLTPHSFSFNSSLGWCPECEGLGTQLGANPAALLRDSKLTLAEGAVALWPDVAKPLSQAMLAALSVHAGIPTDVPFDELTQRARRIVLHGTGDDWIDVFGDKRRAKGKRPLFRFQYKGLYPALDEAARLSTGLRMRLENLVDEVECSVCGGSRLRDDAAAVRFHGLSIDDICRLPLGKLSEKFKRLKLSATQRKIAGDLIREVRSRTQFLADVGLEYLTLARTAPTLSGGESQRIRLASQVGSGLTGVLYVLDEPTIGLHARDNRRLISALFKLRDLGNTVLMVEHDREVVERADQLLDFGPRAGDQGGQIVAHGTPQQVIKVAASTTGPFLSGKRAIPVPTNRRMGAVAEAKQSRKNGKPTKRSPAKKRKTADPSETPTPPGGVWLEIVGARQNNLRDADVRIPLGTLTVVTGVSGSGKSSLVDDVLYSALARLLHRARTVPGAHEAIRGVAHINKVIRVDQQPLGNTPTSNPATYTGVFELIRQLFAQLPESKLRGYSPRRFSFNVPGGRCEECYGNGQICVEMHFLPDVWVECDTCRGKRYNPETLAVLYHGHSIADVLDMSCGRALELFQNIPKIRRVLETLCDVGLDYLRLGQAAPTLSGGEAQRVKLAAELSRPDTGKTLYLLDEPTTGLHFEDLIKLLDVLNRLVELGNTVLVIEHNLDVIKTADWVIDLGPEAGEEGGQLVVCGTPEDVVAHARRAKRSGSSKAKTSKSRAPLLRSYTGEILAPVLAAGPHVARERHDSTSAAKRVAEDLDIQDVGRDVKMPWEVDGRRWHTRNRVARHGQPCKWDGRIVAEVVDRVQDWGTFSPTDWNSRSTVEIAAERKTDGWFFHALTGGEWLVVLKFRVAKRTFQQDELIKRLNLAPLNDMADLPIYSAEPRVKCKNLRTPWQEVDLQVYSFDEIDRPEFWAFLREAVESFQRRSERVAQKPEDVMPWKVLGKKWHLARKGFPPGKKVHWDPGVLEELCGILSGAAPDGVFTWDNQQVVHFHLPGREDPWATIHTKRRAALDLVLTGPKGEFALGRVANLGQDPQFQSDHPERDVIKLRFVKEGDLNRGDLSAFLRDHKNHVTSQPTA